MSGAGGWGQTEHARKVWVSTRHFLSRIRGRMRPKRYHEATREEREKSGRKIHYSEEVLERARPASGKLCLIRALLIFALGALGVYVLLVTSLVVLLIPGLFVAFFAILVWVIYDNHHQEKKVVPKKHIRLKFKR